MATSTIKAMAPLSDIRRLFSDSANAAISPTTNLNSLKTTGMYKGDSFTNIPPDSSSSGIVLVMAYDANYVVQYYNGFTSNRCWFRDSESGVWKNWQCLSEPGYPATTGKIVTSAVNFNSVTESGVLNFPTNEIISSCTNCPSAFAGKLCTWIGGTAKVLNAAWAIGGQKYIDYLGSEYTRTGNADGNGNIQWGLWEKSSLGASIMDVPSDLNNCVTVGSYFCTNATAHTPTTYGICNVVAPTGNRANSQEWLYQVYFPTDNADRLVYMRSTINQSGWCDWRAFHTGNWINNYGYDFTVYGNLKVKTSGLLEVFVENQVVVYNADATAYKPVAASAFNVMSSKLIKENIEEITDDEAKKVLDIRPVSFDYKKSFGGEKNQYGVIAEEAEEIIPFVVSTPENYSEKNFDESKGAIQPIKSVDYSKFVPYLIKMIQIQQKEIEELKTKINGNK